MIIETQIKDVSIKSRISEIVDDRGGNRTKLADEIGISPAYLASVINSSDKNVTSKLLKAFASIDVNLNWLCTGEGEMYQNGGLLERAKKAESEVLELQSDLSKIKYHAQELREMWKDEIKKGNNK